MRAVNKRNLTVVALIVFLAVLAIEHRFKTEPETVPVIEQQASASASGAGAGLAAPAFSLEDSTGKVYKVGGPRQKALIVNFWASWCEPCQLEAPELNKMALKYKDVLDIYGINVTSQDYKPNAERFIRKYMLAFPVMFDSKGKVFDKYQGQVFPTNVLIDKNGVIAEVVLGALTAEELEKKIISLTGS
ncbi:Thiol-disulfide oxidoreductase ResA [Paenibacillus auburnensis]|uniref:Thiol-disulfide oxidoreductase ResA n=1 Tax=Paenibacillus auburnensis TaxID=2905649 RepID=A0ABN8FWY5_9BACL|nr:TlpA disulfide reductase family protein [Paenibacillus auburnensis]CAH1190306.1 Thiol-disulfide oxidoreductase ResA [Paenibacillus auburnensis]